MALFCWCVLVAQLCLTLCDSHGLKPARCLCPWNSPGKNTGVGCYSLLQEIFPTQGLNLGLPFCRQIFTVWATKETLKGWKEDDFLAKCCWGAYFRGKPQKTGLAELDVLLANLRLLLPWPLYQKVDSQALLHISDFGVGLQLQHCLNKKPKPRCPLIKGWIGKSWHSCVKRYSAATKMMLQDHNE